MTMRLLLVVLATSWYMPILRSQPIAPVLFSTNFEGGSLGLIERRGETEFRLHVQGQQDNRGRNRQATWYYFRLDHVKNRDLTLTLTDFVSEYRGRPSMPMKPTMRPVFSSDRRHWEHFTDMAWDNAKGEATLHFRPEHDTIWIAHVAPYTHERLLKLLQEIDDQPVARIEVIGKSSLGRDLPMISVTDPDWPDAAKKVLWLQAREHAWEADTSYIMEGALRFIVSDNPRARELRQDFILIFTPMVDPDGCATGKVRFNAEGYDVDLWEEVDLRGREWLRRLPEKWYVKKAIVNFAATRPIDLMVNLHNTQDGEFVISPARAVAEQERLQKFFDLLVAHTQFDPSEPLKLSPASSGSGWWAEHHVVYALMETRIAPAAKRGRLPTVDDRLAFGRELLLAMAHAVRSP